ncbi:uncharacterized protein F5Z01DRAFT_631779 [Emericellopsis atlantica]|uniref:Uncharacterized protein n=1 Tax=Emericellopsis atlantica TaxID=2614577 RepID=A0A9P8CJW2_9HYPO|nr:uncharacterized protein F5Z01DRAFT_631779 [Emericellopsis atlantica]KAG9249417.1 hypothetical protein F5Z01DRAFT_631779 [Emericellopsis atlantica]
MLTLQPNNYVLEEVTRDDIILASLAWGFTLGIGWLTAWAACKQTMGIYKRHGWRILKNPYFWMIWGEIAVCLGFGIICFMYLLGTISPSFAFYFCILTLWALQVQFLLQIIINRCAILITDRRWSWRLKYGVAALITSINISVYCIWIPARLQISESYIHTNEWWDRCEKGIYLVVDAALNIYFIRIVQQNLVQHGLTKYRGVVRFNMFIITFSLGMDVLIIAMMSLKNTFVYMQFHPLAYIVKLKIELSMAELIAKIAKNRDPSQMDGGQQADFHAHSSSRGGVTSKGAGTVLSGNRDGESKNRAWATVTTTVEMNTMDANGRKVDGRGGTTGYNHSDTETLIDPRAPFSGNATCSSGVEGGASQDRIDHKGGESISSFNSGSNEVHS